MPQQQSKYMDVLPASSVLTVPHSGTSSLIFALMEDGHKVSRFEAEPITPNAIRWAHWWEDWPERFLSRPLVTTLRDPGLSLISSYIRGEEGAIPIHVMSWTRLHDHARKIDRFIPVQELPWNTNDVADLEDWRMRYLNGDGMPNPDMKVAMAYIRPLAMRVYDVAGVPWPGP